MKAFESSKTVTTVPIEPAGIPDTARRKRTSAFSSA
jgi:hypothetical protein